MFEPRLFLLPDSYMPPKKTPVEVKLVDFEELSKTDPFFKGAVGRLDEVKRIAYVNSGLPEQNNGTRTLAVNHELGHALLRDTGTSPYLSKAEEERLVELIAVLNTPDKALSLAETCLKHWLGLLEPEGRLKWLLGLARVRKHPVDVANSLRGKL